jgi:hypothetical protein
MNGWRQAISAASLTALVVLQWGLTVHAQVPDNATDREKLVGVLAELVRASAPRAPSATPSAFALESMPKAVRDAVQTRLMRINEKGEVQVYVLMNPVTEERLRELAAQGVTVEIVDAAWKRVQARIPISRLPGAASLSFVEQIRLPNYAFRMTGGINSEGDAILRSDLARAQLGLTGAGVKVGVISDGIKGIFATGCTTCGGAAGGPMATGDLPPATGTRNASGILTSSSGGILGTSFVSGAGGFPVAGDLEGNEAPGCGFAGAGAEGTALLEIIHDIAPGAQLSFANVDTDVAMNQAVNFLAASNDIVVDDLGFFGLPSDGSSSVSVNTAAALNSSSNRIRAYYTSVGNGAFNHYYGAYTDSGVSGSAVSSGITAAGNVHRFSASAETADVLGLGPRAYNLIRLLSGGEVYVILTWNDPDGASTNDFDLYLVRASNAELAASSRNNQASTRSPVEIIAYTNTTGGDEDFRIVIQNVNNAAQPRNLNLFVLTPQCATSGVQRLAPPSHARLNFVTPTRSLSAQSDAGGSPVSVVSVGAICSASQRTQDLFAGSAAPFLSCFDTTNQTLEHFSAQGPTLDGRTKPDVTAIDGVSVSGAGNFVDPFFGTSASAPHVAGLAALALESAPCLIAGNPGARDNVTARTNLRDLILGNAIPLGGTIPNNMFGYGRADALSSVQAALPIFSGPSSLVVSGNSPSGIRLTPAQLGFSDPHSCPITTLDWSGGCGTGPGATMPCDFGTHTVSVRASNNGVSFASPASLEITVTHFTVAGTPASQTIAAGDSAVFTVTVSAQGGAYTNPVTLSCSGLPAETRCDFNPPAVTPGAGLASSTLTITTTPHPPASAVLRFTLPDDFQFPDRLPGILILIGVGAGLGAAARRWKREVRAGVAGLVAIAMLAIQLACGGGGRGSAPPPAPSAILSATTVNFGPQLMNTTSPALPVTLSNTGTAVLAVSSITASGDFAQSNNCGASLAAGSNCRIDVTFKPIAAGPRAGTLSVTDNAAGSPHTATLTGTGLAGTDAGTYPITISGTAGTLMHSGTVTLVVN